MLTLRRSARLAAALLAALAAALVAAAAPTALASGGPLFAAVGGAGVSHGPTRYVPVVNNSGNDTTLEAISTKDGTVGRTLDLVGQWGVPSTPAGGEGLSVDGRRLVLADVNDGLNSPSLFLVVDPTTMRIVHPITLRGLFSYDAMSPDASRIYFIDYTRTNDFSHYVVRAYDVTTGRLLPGRIADRTQKSWVMEGYPVTRTTSADHRWVYTLYQNPAGYPFVHALDTVGGVAHCVGIPLANQNGIGNLVLSLHGNTLSVHWKSGRPFVNVDRTSWRVAPAHRGGFPYLWVSLLACGSITCLWLARARWAAASRRSSRRQAAGSASTTAPPAQSNAA